MQRLIHARLDKLFTANASLFATTAGVVVADKLDGTRNAVVALILG
ncbi:MAG TPA: hypothetical protein VMV97_04685 [Sulfuriferula sp.]|nr:hypothetical protein [Sulfuriferula sp.]